MHRSRLPAAVLAATSFVFATALAAADPPPAPPAAPPANAPAEPAADGGLKVLRLTEHDDGMRIQLEVVVRKFVPAQGDGPTIDLAGAVHIGDQSFYDALQAHLDALDLVLFEGVKPPGFGADAADQDDEQRASATSKRIRLLAGLLEGHRARAGEYPQSLELLAQESGRLAFLVERARLDGWGAPLVYALNNESDSFELLSFGSDGKPGGEGPAADIGFADQPALQPHEIPTQDSGGGVQKQLADALGLVFQLDAMDHSGAHWRNSDMTVDQVQERLKDAGVDAGPLFQMLEGGGMSGRMFGMLLGLIGASDTLSTMVKAMLAEMLAHADEMFQNLPRQMGATMQVILHERNKVVLQDLRTILSNEPEIQRIGIIYGAGHLPELQKRLIEDFNYHPAGEQWIPAIEIDFAKAGISPQRVKMMRDMMRQSMQRQLRALEGRPRPDR